MLGYSLPLSPSGKSSLVDAPPWAFGGTMYEVIYRVQKDIADRFLPDPLKSKDGLVSITMLDMTSVANKDQAYDFPERTQFHECMFKIYCEYNDEAFWYVPTTFVDKDFSLVRGTIQGFGKKLATIHMTKLEELNPWIGGREKGAKIKCRCETFGGITVTLSLTLTERTEENRYPSSGLLMHHYIPDITNPDQPLCSEILKQQIERPRRVDVWHAVGEVVINSSELDEITLLQPLEVVYARSYKEGFWVTGAERIIKGAY